jgi:hypothetical protein
MYFVLELAEETKERRGKAFKSIFIQNLFLKFQSYNLIIYFFLFIILIRIRRIL